MRTHVRLLALPLRVQLGNRWPDRESPRENREVLELLRHHVAVLRFFGRNSRLVHFLGLPSDVVKHFADRSDAFLAANLAVTWDKERVLIEPGEFLSVSRHPETVAFSSKQTGYQPLKGRSPA